MEILKSKLKHTIISAVIYGLIGLYLFISPNSASLTIGMIIGIAMLVAGIIKATMLVNSKIYSQLQITGTAVLVILGAVLLIRPQIAANFMGFILGIAIIVAGIYKFQFAMLFKSYSGGKTTVEAVLGVLCVALGIIALINPFTAGAMVLSVIGVCLMITALSEGITAYNVYQYIKNYAEYEYEHTYEQDDALTQNRKDDDDIIDV